MSDPVYENTGPVNYRLIEECSELIKEICKAERFGMHDWHPADPERTPNIQRIRNEIADVRKAIEKWEAAFPCALDSHDKGGGK